MPQPDIPDPQDGEDGLYRLPEPKKRSEVSGRHYVTRNEFDELTGNVKDLHFGLFGSRDFPGGKLGLITEELTTMPQRIIDSIEKKRRDSRRSFIWDLTKILIGVGGAIVAAYISYRGIHK